MVFTTLSCSGSNGRGTFRKGAACETKKSKFEGTSQFSMLRQKVFLSSQSSELTHEKTGNPSGCRFSFGLLPGDVLGKFPGAIVATKNGKRLFHHVSLSGFSKLSFGQQQLE